MPDGYENSLVTAWSHARCDPDEVSALAGHAAACPACRDEAAARQMLVELSVDRPEWEDGSASAASLGSLLDAARARRRPAPAVPPFASPFAAAAGMVDAVLAEADSTALARPSPVLDWSVGDLVAHLAAGNAQLAAVLPVGSMLPVTSVLPVEAVVSPDADLVTVTRAVLAATADLPSDAVHRLWRAGVDAIAAALLAEPDLADQVVEVDGHRTTVAAHIIVRAFETWIHARDIAAAAGITLPAPTGETVGPMARVAARVLDGRPAPITPGRTGTVRLNLTGPGGGSMLVGVGAPAAVAPRSADLTADLTADIVGFCLLVAGRAAPADLELAVTGDAGLVRELLALAPTISGP